MYTVLITDGLLRKSLTAARSLGSKGINAIVGEKSWFSPGGFSKYCHKRIKYPDPSEDPVRFQNWLLHWLKQEDNPVLIPMDDAVMDIVMEHKEIKSNCICILPPKESYDIASDKYETMMLAARQQVNRPATFLPANIKELQEIADIAPYPLVIKPRKGSGSRGIRKVENKDDLLKVYEEISRQYPNPMVQECIPLGDRFDVCLLYSREHDVKAVFVQKEIRHFPIEMGPSTLQESVAFESLIEQSIHLLKPLNWSGIVEVEYMIDSRTNRPVLMEINPRFWNSLDLAVQCGIDFPYLLFQLALDEDISNTKDYQIGRMSRWLFPGDLLHFLVNSKRLSMKPALLSGKKHSVYDDTFRLSDPMPGVILIAASIRFAFSLKYWKMFFQR